MEIFINLVIFGFGLIIGSFLNVLIYRFPRELGLGGRSFCPKCHKQINWYDNIPLLSYVFLLGKCRNCHKKISLWYFIIEIVTALGFILFWNLFTNSNFLYTSFINQNYGQLGSVGISVLVFVIISILIPIFVIDAITQIIPDELSFLGFTVITIVLLLFGKELFYANLLSAFVCAGILLLIHLITLGKGMGLGDVKLALIGGLFFGLPYSLVWLLLSFILGGIYGTVLLIFKKANLKSKVSFGPFLILSFIISIVFAQRLLNLLYLK